MTPTVGLIISAIATVGGTIESQRQQRAAAKDAKEARQVEAAAAKARSRSQRMAQIRRAQKARARAVNITEATGVGQSTFAISAGQDQTQIAASNISELETQSKFGSQVSAHLQDQADRLGNASQAQAAATLGSTGLSIFSAAYQPSNSSGVQEYAAEQASSSVANTTALPARSKIPVTTDYTDMATSSQFNYNG